MADSVKISALPEATQVTNSDYTVIDDGVTTKKIAVDSIIVNSIKVADYLSLSLPSGWSFADSRANILIKIGNYVFARFSINSTADVTNNDIYGRGYLAMPSGFAAVNNSRYLYSGYAWGENAALYQGNANEIRIDGNGAIPAGHFVIFGMWEA